MTSLVVTVFLLVYLGMIFGGLPFLQLDRTGIALLGAIVLVASQVISVEEAYRSLHSPTLILLFAFMVISAQLESPSRENRTPGSEGGGGERRSLPLSLDTQRPCSVRQLYLAEQSLGLANENRDDSPLIQAWRLLMTSMILSSVVGRSLILRHRWQRQLTSKILSEYCRPETDA